MTVYHIQGIHGEITCSNVAESAALTCLCYQYPLRLMSPTSHDPLTKEVYILNYGGGLVSGDVITLNVMVESGVTLRLLTQSSTKVFKRRESTLEQASQRMSAYVHDGATLYIQPEPITCFENAAYAQSQTFHLGGPSASLYLVDWMTSGRMSRGESWLFSRFSTKNEIYLDHISSTPVMIDHWRLEQGKLENLHDYENLCTVILIGPKFLSLAQRVLQDPVEFDHQGVFWSASPIIAKNNQIGCIIRLASTTTSSTSVFLQHLQKYI